MTTDPANLWTAICDINEALGIALARCNILDYEAEKSDNPELRKLRDNSRAKLDQANISLSWIWNNVTNRKD